MSSSNKPEITVFDVWAPFAYFRKAFTTTSALTFSFIPRSVIEGLIGAILGIRRSTLFTFLANAKIAIEILTEVKKIPFSVNYTNSDFWKTINQYLEERTTNVKNLFNSPTSIELLVNPKYRIYYYNKSKYHQALLESALLNHHSVYVPYLGTSSMIANFSYLFSYPYDIVHKEIAEICSVIPYYNNLPDFVIEADRMYAVEQNIPARLNQNRELVSSFSALYNPQAKPISIHNIEVNSFNHEGREINFVFLPS